MRFFKRDTAFIGSANDSTGVGAAWVFIRSDSTWAPQRIEAHGKAGEEVGKAANRRKREPVRRWQHRPRRRARRQRRHRGGVGLLPRRRQLEQAPSHGR